jgi:hypothetical protein
MSLPHREFVHKPSYVDKWGIGEECGEGDGQEEAHREEEGKNEAKV